MSVDINDWTEIHTAAEVTDDMIQHFADIGNASYGLGNRWVVDWDRFWDMLASFHGYDVVGGPAMDKVQRIVRKMVKEGEIQ